MIETRARKKNQVKENLELLLKEHTSTQQTEAEPFKELLGGGESNKTKKQHEDTASMCEFMNIRSFDAIKQELCKRTGEKRLVAEPKLFACDGSEFVRERVNTRGKNGQQPSSAQIAPAVSEPLNMWHFYSSMHKRKPSREYRTLADDNKGVNPGFWPYTTKTERMIIQDALHMLQGLESDTFCVRKLVKRYRVRKKI